ncbi:PEGA domain-containing protein [Proteinivorax tanatarense]|uniref:PEGA domain-containing protein n=1 Tax=Proteinivorax tanatarense TaxID=1260629 RepID=A0AAU7VJ51_9FIRM
MSNKEQNSHSKHINKINELPDVKAPLGTKEKMLSNILEEENNNYSLLHRLLPHIKPLAFVASMVLLFFFANLKVGIIPQTGVDEFDLKVISNIEGAEVFLDGQKIGNTPMTYTMEKDEGDINSMSIRKPGYLIWQGDFQCGGPEELIQSFESSDEYSIFFSNNQVNIEGKLMPANPNMVKLDSNAENTSVMLNGRWVGETPITLELEKNYNNHLKLIAPDKDKVTLSLSTGDKLKLGESENAQLKYSEHGYAIHVTLEDIWIPKHSIWLNDNNVAKFLQRDGELKTQVINLERKEIRESSLDEVLKEFLTIENYDEIYGDSLQFEEPQIKTLNISDIIRKKANISNNSLFGVKEGPEILIEDLLTGTVYADIKGEHKVLNSSTNAIYLWSEQENIILRYCLVEEESEVFSLGRFPKEIEEIKKVKKYHNQLILLIDDEIYFKEDGSFKNPEGFNNMEYFILDEKGEHMLIFVKENYLNIWQYNLNSGEYKKIY